MRGMLLAAAALAVGFVGGLTVGRIIWRADRDVDVPTEFAYLPPLRVVGGDELAAAIARHPAGRRLAR